MDIKTSQIQAMLEFRRNRDWSQERLARDLGVAAKSVYRWEKGVCNPSTKILNRFEQLKFHLTVPLTQREIEVLQLVAQGATNNSIAQSLFVSENTVKTHLLHILKKLNLKHRKDAVTYAIREGLAD